MAGSRRAGRALAKLYGVSIDDLLRIDDDVADDVAFEEKDKDATAEAQAQEAAVRPFGAVGPTTASRMDFAAPALHRAGVAATVGKGRRSSEVRDACRATGSVYFVACGGAAAYLAKCVASSETVAYDDLGTEALRRIDVVDFPVFVGVDVRGRDVYDLV